MPKKMTYQFNLNYLKNIDENIDIPATTKKYAALMKPFLTTRFKYYKVTVKAIKTDSDAEMHDVHFDADSRNEEIQTTSIVRSHITTMFKTAKEWIVYKKDKKSAPVEDTPEAELTESSEK